MKYEKPELTALTPAIEAIQINPKTACAQQDGVQCNEVHAAYADWEE